MRRDEDRRNHYSIRKLSVGAASVLVGATIYLGVGSSEIVHADDINNNVIESVEKTNEAQAAKQKNAEAEVNRNNSTSIGNNKDIIGANSAVEGPDRGTPDVEDPMMEQAKAEANILPQTAVKDEVPELDPSSLANGAYNYAHNIDSSVFYNETTTAKWIKEPDVKKSEKLLEKLNFHIKTMMTTVMKLLRPLLCLST